MNAWEMILAHRYQEALSWYQSEVRTSHADGGLRGEYATLLLCLRHFPESLENFKQANRLQDPRLKGESQPYLRNIGATQWLLGQHQDAVRAFTASVDGVLNGSIKFGDNAGGVSQGLLLWYGGVTAGSVEARKHALKYLEKLAKRSRIKWWPGPLALFVLGKKSQEEVLNELIETTDVNEGITRAKTDLLKRRELVQALFYFATHQRAEGCEQACRAGMIQCASLENPILEVEWYLAQAEAESASDSSATKLLEK